MAAVMELSLRRSNEVVTHGLSAPLNQKQNPFYTISYDVDVYTIEDYIFKY